MTRQPYIGPDGRQWWTVEEAALRWGVAERRVYKWIRGRAGSKGRRRLPNGELGPQRRTTARIRLSEGTDYVKVGQAIFLRPSSSRPTGIDAPYERPRGPEMGQGVRRNAGTYATSGEEIPEEFEPPDPRFFDPYGDPALLRVPVPQDGQSELEARAAPQRPRKAARKSASIDPALRSRIRKGVKATLADFGIEEAAVISAAVADIEAQAVEIGLVDGEGKPHLARTDEADVIRDRTREIAGAEPETPPEAASGEQPGEVPVGLVSDLLLQLNPLSAPALDVVAAATARYGTRRGIAATPDDFARAIPTYAGQSGKSIRAFVAEDVFEPVVRNFQLDPLERWAADARERAQVRGEVVEFLAKLSEELEAADGKLSGGLGGAPDDWQLSAPTIF